QTRAAQQHGVTRFNEVPKVDTSENLWIAGVIALAVGFIMGIIVALLAPGLTGRSASSTQAQLESLQLRLEEYQQEVASNFNTTASLVSRLNKSYQDIQEHLGQPAVELAPDEMTRQRLLAALDQDSVPDSRERVEPVFDSLEPPRDYADKTPDSPGTLSEEFGVKRTCAILLLSFNGNAHAGCHRHPLHKHITG